jgi:site-specific recombinase XerC
MVASNDEAFHESYFSSRRNLPQTNSSDCPGLRPEDYGTHSLRRTKASIIYKQTGDLRAGQILLGHTKIESTVRYIGVDVENARSLAESTEV